MGDAVLRALESEGILLDTSVDAVAPVGFSFLGECKSTLVCLENHCPCGIRPILIYLSPHKMQNAS